VKRRTYGLPLTVAVSAITVVECRDCKCGMHRAIATNVAHDRPCSGFQAGHEVSGSQAQVRGRLERLARVFEVVWTTWLAEVQRGLWIVTKLSVADGEPSKEMQTGTQVRTMTKDLCGTVCFVFLWNFINRALVLRGCID